MNQPLDKITKFASQPSTLPDTLDGFISQYGTTAARFYLQSIARVILPDERIKVCWRYRVPNRPGVEIIYSQERKRARTTGLMKCGSGWVCAPCQAAIVERRREELKRALENSSATMVPFLVTYTMQHDRSDRLAKTLQTLLDSYRAMRSGRAWQLFKEDYAAVGSIRATEITWSRDNGYHPHFHEILFLDAAKIFPGAHDSVNHRGEVVHHVQNHDIETIRTGLYNTLFDMWSHQIRRSGRVTSGKAFDVRSARQDVADYVAKWGHLPHDGEHGEMAREVANVTTKRGRGDGHLTPHEILYLAPRSKLHCAVWAEYAHETKGKSALHWSPGLKAKLQVDEMSDQEAAQGIATDTDILLAELSFDAWDKIQAVGQVAQVMSIAHTGDPDALAAHIDRVLNL